MGPELVVYNLNSKRMKPEDIQKGQLISAGSYNVSIGTYDTGDVAIMSKSNGGFVLLSQAKRSKKLRAVRRAFRVWINSEETFTFQHMGTDRTVQLIELLKKR